MKKSERIIAITGMILLCIALIWGVINDIIYGVEFKKSIEFIMGLVNG